MRLQQSYGSASNRAGSNMHASTQKLSHEELVSIYRRGLLEDVLPFWMAHSVDREHGGFMTALDRDGTVARRYAVQASPQTVVIDRTGRVARVFVGDDALIAGSLRTVLKELAETAGPSPAAGHPPSPDRRGVTVRQQRADANHRDVEHRRGGPD